MKKIAALALTIFLLVNFSSAQQYRYCESFETPNSTDRIVIDTLSLWKIGTPMKQVLDSSFQSTHSIVTLLDSTTNQNDTNKIDFNDTSVFYFWSANPIGGSLDDYRYPVILSFRHRFQVDSGAYGALYFSILGSDNWYNLLQIDSTIYPNGVPFWASHTNLNTLQTTYGELNIEGSSHGWVHTTIQIAPNIFNLVDSTPEIGWNFKFVYYTENINVTEGWQIDNLCVETEYITATQDLSTAQPLQISPNPNQGDFYLQEGLYGHLKIYDINGRLVHSHTITEPQQNLELTKGIYLIMVENEEAVYQTKMIVN